MELKEDTPSSDYSKSEERPNTEEDYNSAEEIVWLQFKFILGEALFTKEQQD